MHQRCKLRAQVVEVAACPAHQRRFQLRLEVGDGGQDGFGQLQSFHRFAEQPFACLVAPSLERGAVADRLQPVRQHRIHRRIHDVAAQAFLRPHSMAAYSRPVLGETGSCLRACFTLSARAISSRRRTPRGWAASASARSANTCKATVSPSSRRAG